MKSFHFTSTWPECEGLARTLKWNRAFVLQFTSTQHLLTRAHTPFSVNHWCCRWFFFLSVLCPLFSSLVLCRADFCLKIWYRRARWAHTQTHQTHRRISCSRIPLHIHLLIVAAMVWCTYTIENSAHPVRYSSALTMDSNSLETIFSYWTTNVRAHVRWSGGKQAEMNKCASHTLTRARTHPGFVDFHWAHFVYASSNHGGDSDRHLYVCVSVRCTVFVFLYGARVWATAMKHTHTHTQEHQRHRLWIF